MSRTFIVTGASGAIGALLLPCLMKHHPDSRVIALLRSDEAAQSVRSRLDGASQARLETVRADLSRRESVPQALQRMPRLDAAVGIHMAADVSWDKSAEELTPANVAGTLHFADILEQAVRKPRLVFVSTAFTQMADWTYRNGYEETKAQAERLLRAGFGLRHPMVTYSCSLVVGSAADGSITRFHGIYPLIRFLARFSPPFLVGNKTGRFDLIPLDWAVEQLLHAIQLLLEEPAPQDVVASAGEQRVSYERLVEIVLDRINADNAQAGVASLPAMPILRTRQWKFLKRSLAAWRPPGVNERDFRYFERLLEVYGQYAENDTVRAPLNVSAPSPSPERFLPRVVDHWLQTHHRPVRNKVEAAA
jgi:nucleoside-diphosphate-sugar epimerase